MKKKMFHVHTYRCKHMDDNKCESEYINKAIELGVTEIWFTDHAPFPGNLFNNRMMMEELPEYVAVLQELKKKYAEKIDVKIGLEIEYLSNLQSYYKELHASGNFDVLLLGQHFSFLEDGRYSFSMKDKRHEARVLADGMIAGMETGLFSVVAHPDQIFRRYMEWNEETEVIAREIKECAVRTGVALEKNVSNMIGKKKRGYWTEFWREIPREMKCVYGLDAHSIIELEENYLALAELKDG